MKKFAAFIAVVVFGTLIGTVVGSVFGYILKDSLGGPDVVNVLCIAFSISIASALMSPNVWGKK